MNVDVKHVVEFPHPVHHTVDIPQLQQLIGVLMTLPTIVQAAVDKIDASAVKVVSANSAMLLTFSQILDALRAVQGQPTILAADLDAAVKLITDKLDAVALADTQQAAVTV